MDVRDGTSAPEAVQGQSKLTDAQLEAQNGPPFLIHEHKSGTPIKTRVCEPFDGDPDLPNESESGRLRKYRNRVRRSREFAKWLAHHAPDRANKLSECGSHLTFRQFYTHPEQPTKLSGAVLCQQSHLCDMCAARRASRNLASAVPKIQKLLADNPHLRPYLLTITSKDRDDLRRMKSEQITAWSRWLQLRRDSMKQSGRRRKPSALAEFAGGVMSWECKRGSGSGLWHLHAHGICLGRYGLTVDRFQQEWADLLGYWPQVHLTPLRSAVMIEAGHSPSDVRDLLSQDLLEVFKYALKTADLAYQDRWDAAQILHGVNLVRAFGICRGVKDLGEYLDDVSEFAGLPYLETVFRYLNGEYEKAYSGYTDENGDVQRPRVQAFDDFNAGCLDTKAA